jgi:SAM-dependent methyltransferase
MHQMSEIIKTYSDLPFHKMIGELIKAHSENKRDIRDVAKGLIDMKKVRAMLDLGCGYGWFEEALEGQFDLILGIDCLEVNGAAFLKTAESISKKAVFKRMTLPKPTEIETECFDLVVSTYSLYFFPEAIPEVDRLLCPDGTFLVITHSESMLKEGEPFFEFNNLKKFIGHFSAENGEAILRRYFSDVRFIDYPNTLLFREDESDHLARYIDFKRGFISRQAGTEAVKERMLEELRKKGSMMFNKNDRIFIARK